MEKPTQSEMNGILYAKAKRVRAITQEHINNAVEVPLNISFVSEIPKRSLKRSNKFSEYPGPPLHPFAHSPAKSVTFDTKQ